METHVRVPPKTYEALGLRVGDIVAVDSGNCGIVTIGPALLAVDATSVVLASSISCGDTSGAFVRQSEQLSGDIAVMYRVPAGKCRTASSLFLHGGAELRLSRAQLGAQLAVLLDGAIVPFDGMLHVQCGRLRSTLRVLRAVPIDAQLLRIARHTLIVVVDVLQPPTSGSAVSAFIRATGPSGRIVGSSARASPWRQGPLDASPIPPARVITPLSPWADASVPAEPRTPQTPRPVTPTVQHNEAPYGVRDPLSPPAVSKDSASVQYLHVHVLHEQLHGIRELESRKPVIVQAAEPSRGAVEAGSGAAEASSGAAMPAAAVSGNGDASAPSAMLKGDAAVASPNRGAAVSPLEGEAVSQAIRVADWQQFPRHPAATSAAPAAITAAVPRHASHIPFSGPPTPLEMLCDLVLQPLIVPRVATSLHVQPPRGVLLRGPTGCGKSTLVRALVATAQGLPPPGVFINVLEVTAAQLASSEFGAAERHLRQVWAKARTHAFPADGCSEVVKAPSPRLALIVLKDVESICPRRAAGLGGSAGASAGAARVVAQVLTLMDGATVSPSPQCSTDAGLSPHIGAVVVVATSSKPDMIEPALRRPGRIDRELRVRPPDAHARGEILMSCTRSLSLTPQGTASLADIGRRAVGFSGADLAAIIDTAARNVAAAAAASAALSPLTRGPNMQQLPPIDAVDLESALESVGASSLRSGDVSATVHPARRRRVNAADEDPWASIGGMDETITLLRRAVEAPLSRPAAYSTMHLAPPRGVLLYGPPGNSKTGLAAALAASCGATFFVLSGADVYSPYVGEAERVIRETFARAREATPAVVFLDEVDALVGRRGIGENGGSSTASGILATLLTEMDGVASCDGVVVLAATNRPDALDPALLRPGRLEVHIRVPTPDVNGRAAILAVHCRKMPVVVAVNGSYGVDFGGLAKRTDGWSGAQLENLCREAGMAALRRAMRAPGRENLHFAALEVSPADFEDAMAAVSVV